MKKPEKNKKKKLAKIKRGTKRAKVFKKSREVVVKNRQQNLLEKSIKQKKIDDLMDKILQSRFNQ